MEHSIRKTKIHSSSKSEENKVDTKKEQEITKLYLIFIFRLI